MGADDFANDDSPSVSSGDLEDPLSEFSGQPESGSPNNGIRSGSQGIVRLRFRPCDMFGQELTFSFKDIPKFNLTSVSCALSEGWDPKVAWTVEELIFVQDPEDNEYEWSSRWYTFNTALHRALALDQFDTASCLLEYGVNINQLNALGRTALHEAVESTEGDWLQRLSWIVAHGADLNIKTQAPSMLSKELMDWELPAGLSPLMMAMELAELAKITVLLDAGATVNQPVDRDSRWRLLDIALMSRQPSIIEALVHAGASFSVHVDQDSPLEASDNDEQTQARLRELAQTLTSYCISGSSRHAIPPPECQEIFSVVLQTSQFRRAWDAAIKDGSDGPASYQRIVDAFFEMLTNIGEMRNPLAITLSYCARCRDSISRLSLLPTSSRTHSSSLRELQRLSAEGNCALCRLLLDALIPLPESDSFDARMIPVAAPSDNVFFADSSVTLRRDDPGESAGQILKVACGDKTSRLRFGPVEESWLSDTIDHKANTATGTGSPGALHLGKAWLNQCRSSHPQCRRAQDIAEPRLPSRVLDVLSGSPIDPITSLVETRGQMTGSYCALSYCWGTARVLTTTRSNLKKHIRALPLDALPATIQDAIIVTRALGLRYLWIDSLCIVQDDPDDWDREAAMMTDVYANATITVSTLVGTAAVQSLFTPRVIRQPSPVAFPVPWHHFMTAPNPLPVLEPVVPNSNSDMIAGKPSHISFRGPIHSRGWCLQEEVLTARILWFGRGYLQWRCPTRTAIEPHPNSGFYDDSDAYSYLSSKAHGTIHQLLNADTKAPDRESIFKTWRRIVAEYTKRNLTVESDRVTAILGIAKLMQPALKCDFVAGMWAGDLFVPSLAWRVIAPRSAPPPVERARGNGFPSWSWAACGGSPVDYRLVADADGRKEELVAQVVSTDVSLEGRSQKSAVGSITVRGAVGVFDLADANKSKVPEGPGVDADFHLDVMPSLPETGQTAPAEEVGPQLWALDIIKLLPARHPLMRDDFKGPPRPGSTIRLILEAADALDPPQTFRRVGIGRFWWDATDRATVREVKLV